jgi:hypothetical protein
MGRAAHLVSLEGLLLRLPLEMPPAACGGSQAAANWEPCALQELLKRHTWQHTNNNQRLAPLAAGCWLPLSSPPSNHSQVQSQLNEIQYTAITPTRIAYAAGRLAA